MDDGTQSPSADGGSVDPVADTAVGAVVQRRLVRWSPDGSPVVTAVPMIPKDQLAGMAAAALSLPYEGKEPEYQGMTCAEVNLSKRAKNAALTGDSDEGEKLFDRAIGKPKQSSESVKINVTYEDYLKSIAEKTATPAAAPIEAEVVKPDEDIFS